MPKRRKGRNPVRNKKANAGGGEDPPTSDPSPSPSSSKGIRNFENEELERAMLAPYREKKTDASIIVYRLNAWKRVDPPEDIIDKDYYKGWVNVDVNRSLQSNKILLTRPYRGSCYPGGFRPPIFLYPTHHKVSEFHCVIEPPNYPADHVWIKDEKSEHGTFVNGARIPKGEKYPLMDGDIIGLGAPHHSLEDHWGEDNKKRGLVFKVKSLIKGCKDELDNQAEGNSGDGDSGPKFEAMNNNVILAEIFSFLSYAELKTGRLVNKFWKGMVDPRIFSRSAFKIGNYKDYTPSFLRNMNIPTWKIDIRGKEQFYRTDGKLEPDDPLIEENVEKKREKAVKIMNLLKQKGNTIRDFDLMLGYDSEEDIAPIITMVETMPNLETLRVHLVVLRKKVDVPGKDVSNQTFTLTLPGVKHLYIGGVYRVNYQNLDWEDNYNIILQMAKLCPNVQQITTKGQVRTENVLRYIFTNNLWTTALNELACEGSWTENGDTGQREIFDLIHNLPRKLKKLVLHKLPKFVNPLEIASFENMLRKHSDTLEQLVLRFNNGPSTDEPEVILRFPTFPKLKILEFILEQQQRKILNFKILNFKIMFPTSGSGSICYERDFPAIKVLRLPKPQPTNTLNWNTAGSGGEFDFSRTEDVVLEIFVPTGTDTVSRTMTWMEFVLPWKTRRGCNEWYTDFVERFRRMFPHVHHPHLIHCSEKGEESGSLEKKEEKTEGPSDSSEEEEERQPTPPPTRMRTRSCLT